MIIWIIQTIIFIILMCILGFIIYLPYALIQMWVRSILYKMGFDCYTEQEKVTLGLIEKNRIEDLKNKKGKFSQIFNLQFSTPRVAP